MIPGEDCLNLNVWTPDAGAGGLPVLVWIHGGSFMNGSGSVGAYDGTAFARDGVVCVTINYRLAAEGFLFLGDGIANLGLLDQLAALRWVQDNIAAFGGDPARVTIAGESAGAMSVTTLLSMPLAAGLVRPGHRAERGRGAHADRGRGPDGRRLPGRGARRAAGPGLDQGGPAGEARAGRVGPGGGGADHPGPGQVGPARAEPAAVRADRRRLGRCPAAPLASIAAGQGGNVPLLIGSNRDEARLFLVAASTIDLIDEPTLAAVAGAYGLSGEALAVYRAGRPGASPGDLLAAVITDWFFRIPPIRVAEARGRGGRGRHLDVPVRPPGPGDNHRLGACHAAEIPFVFDTTSRAELRPLIGDTPSPAVADQAHRVWVDFITRGDPGWARYDVERRTTGLLADADHRGRRPGRRRARPLGRHPVAARVREAASEAAGGRVGI